MRANDNQRRPPSRSIIPFFILMGAACFIFLPHAYAYLDGGTAAIVFQMIAASALGALFFFKSWWWKVKSFFVRTPRGESESDD